MKREVQVHFENCGQLAWIEDILDVQNWLVHVMQSPSLIAYDAENKRHLAFDMKTVTAIIVSEKSENTDMWSRTYAFVQRNIEENSQQEHSGDGGKRPPPETGGRCCY